MQTTWIYCLKDPVTGAVRYVGKSDNPEIRFRKHLISFKKRSDHRSKWIGRLMDIGLVPILEKLDNIPKEGWQEIEKEYIRVFRAIGFKLTNWSDGGEAPMDGKKHSMEARAKMSARGKGKPKSPSHIVNFSNALRGKPKSQSHREKVSASKRANPKSYTHLIKLNLSRIGKPLTQEHRSKISSGGKGLKRSDITRARISAARMGRSFAT